MPQLSHRQQPLGWHLHQHLPEPHHHLVADHVLNHPDLVLQMVLVHLASGPDRAHALDFA